MRRFGLIGGTSWHSTVNYYAGLNQRFNDHFGDNTNPPLVIYNMNQAEVHQLQKEDNWDAIAKLNQEALEALRSGGVEGVALCANTPHKIYDTLADNTNIPIIHIADATADMLLQDGCAHPLLIGTKFTMSGTFITRRLADRGVKVEVPSSEQQLELHRIIFDELVYGNILQQSQQYVTNLFEEFNSAYGVDSIILGCTEFGILMDGVEVIGPKVDTVEAHIEAIARFILKDP